MSEQISLGGVLQIRAEKGFSVTYGRLILGFIHRVDKVIWPLLRESSPDISSIKAYLYRA